MDLVFKFVPQVVEMARDMSGGAAAELASAKPPALHAGAKHEHGGNRPDDCDAERSAGDYNGGGNELISLRKLAAAIGSGKFVGSRKL